MSIRGRIITVPLDVYRRESDEYIKTTQLQIKIKNEEVDGETVFSLLCACQEGMYAADLSPIKVKRSKTKQDLNEQDWNALFSFLFRENTIYDKDEPELSHSVEVAARLHSLETYDEDGELEGDLADEPPDLTIMIRSKGRLSVEYGSFHAQVKESENASLDEKRELDILNWVLLQSEQLDNLLTKVGSLTKELESVIALASSREEEIKQITDDYSLILRDLEDRAFQVINAKRRRILELQGSSVDELKHLNEKFEEKNRNNLDRVRIEEILKGKDYETFEEREKAKQELKRLKPKRGTATRSTGKRGSKATKESIKSEDEPLDNASKMDIDEDQPIKEENNSSVDSDEEKQAVIKEEDSDSQDGIRSAEEEQEPQGESEGEDEGSDATEYSEEDTQFKREDVDSHEESGESEDGNDKSGVSNEEENEDDDDTDYSE